MIYHLYLPKVYLIIINYFKVIIIYKYISRTFWNRLFFLSLSIYSLPKSKYVEHTCLIYSLKYVFVLNPITYMLRY